MSNFIVVTLAGPNGSNPVTYFRNQAHGGGAHTAQQNVVVAAKTHYARAHNLQINQVGQSQVRPNQPRPANGIAI